MDKKPKKQDQPSMPLFDGRKVVCAKDVMILTGKSLRTAYRILKDIRVSYNKAKHQVVTTRELTEYLGIRD
ncbi:hypothetical protein MASR2M44_24440 [Bacteroidota bacterium]